MFYVLFTYSKGRKERDFRKFRSEDDLINFLHANYESIDIVQILGAERIYKLGLIETEELAKSTLIRQEIEADLPDPEETKEEEIMRKNKEALQRGEAAIVAAKKDLAKTNTKLIINQRKSQKRGIIPKTRIVKRTGNSVLNAARIRSLPGIRAAAALNASNIKKSRRN